MRLDLPTDLLRSFVAIADAGGIVKAAERVHRTQPAISLQVKRLERLLGAALLRRHGRGVALTEAGERLLGYARRILALNDEAVAALAPAALAGPVRFGTIQDFADTALPGVLARFAAENPGVCLDVRVGNSMALIDAVTAGGLDLVLGSELRPGGTPLRREPMRWIGAATGSIPTDAPSGTVVPLVLMEAPCPFRDAALAALDRAERAWRIVYTSPSLAGVRAAVRAGLGVTCRTAALATEGLRPVEGLPALPDARFALYGGVGGEVASAPPAVRRLAEILAVAVGAGTAG